MKNFLFQTLKGGIFFMLPMVLILLLFGKLFEILKPLSIKIGQIFQIENSFLDAPYYLTILLILILCFLAGNIAKLGVAKRVIIWVENNVLTLFPGYQLIKSTYESKLGLEQSENFPVVLVPIDGWMFAFLVEDLDESHSLVFVPSSPESWSGNIVIFEKAKMKKTSLQKSDLIKINRQLGIESKQILKGKLSLD